MISKYLQDFVLIQTVNTHLCDCSLGILCLWVGTNQRPLTSLQTSTDSNFRIAQRSKSQTKNHVLQNACRIPKSNAFRWRFPGFARLSFYIVPGGGGIMEQWWKVTDKGQKKWSEKKNPVPMQLCLWGISHALAWDRTRFCAVTEQQLSFAPRMKFV